jgi:hypothetical protein
MAMKSHLKSTIFIVIGHNEKEEKGGGGGVCGAGIMIHE